MWQASGLFFGREGRFANHVPVHIREVNAGSESPNGGGTDTWCSVKQSLMQEDGEVLPSSRGESGGAIEGKLSAWSAPCVSKDWAEFQGETLSCNQAARRWLRNSRLERGCLGRGPWMTCCAIVDETRDKGMDGIRKSKVN